VIPNETPTVIACLTPPGQAALSAFGLYGPCAWEVIRKLFRRITGERLPAEPVLGRFWLGRLGGEVADEVVVSVKRTHPLSLIEVHSHGGREVARFILDLFREQGAQDCSWEEFLRRTESDAVNVEAAIALTTATTLRTASILLDQQNGALRRAIDAILLALQDGDQATAEARLRQLMRYASVGRHLTQPWRIVVAGAPNVGKSSLVNALAGYQRSIVAPTPGTTRDVVTTRLALDGWAIELADTAGMRSEAEHLERQGIHRARQSITDADLCLWILDASSPPVWPDQNLDSVQFIINKCDLASVWDCDQSEAVRISAKTGEGIAELCKIIVDRLIPDVPPEGTAVPFTSRQCRTIEEAQSALAAGDVKQALRLLSSLGHHATTL
jgi:tRNA modification GTPase